ncbi:hypothetical protein GYMLUDRAFT_34984, partial [Collybiopsis luxurians FD-317 M1]
MKNMLLRSLNSIADIGYVMNGDHDFFGTFVNYVATFAEVTSLHLQASTKGDERFFIQPNGQGKKLVGATCDPNIVNLQTRLKNLTEKQKSGNSCVFFIPMFTLRHL